VPARWRKRHLASAGRPFSTRVLADLARHDVAVAQVTLHTGVSSTEAGETPPPEWYRVPHAAAQQVNTTHTHGGRVIAVGTTVARALESASDPHGQLDADAGWTELVLGPDRAPRVVDGLITGWHEPDASHLLLLEAVAGPEWSDALTPRRWPLGTGGTNSVIPASFSGLERMLARAGARELTLDPVPTPCRSGRVAGQLVAAATDQPLPGWNRRIWTGLGAQLQTGQAAGGRGQGAHSWNSVSIWAPPTPSSATSVTA
jgi:hypothetical protein